MDGGRNSLSIVFPLNIPQRPVVCVDETFKQLIGETRAPLPPRPGSLERVDHACTRNGVASLFLACEPLQGWRTHRSRCIGAERIGRASSVPFWRNAAGQPRNWR
jgi:hypothetical protein